MTPISETYSNPLLLWHAALDNSQQDYMALSKIWYNGHMEGKQPLSILRHYSMYRKFLSGHRSALPVPAPEPSEVHLEDCLLEQSLAGQPQSELKQLEEVLLLLVALK